MRLIANPSPQPTPSPIELTARPSVASIARDLAPRHPEMAQHAELAAARKHERAERRRESGETDHHGSELERIGHGERAIEHPQRRLADLLGPRDFESLAARNGGADRRLECGPIDAVGEPQRRLW